VWKGLGVVVVRWVCRRDEIEIEIGNEIESEDAMAMMTAIIAASVAGGTMGRDACWVR